MVDSVKEEKSVDSDALAAAKSSYDAMKAKVDAGGHELDPVESTE